MDEPFSALDPLIRDKLQDELLDLQKELNRTIIFVSHDLDEAAKIGSRIAIMEGGRVIQLGTSQEIVKKPATPYVADFVSHMNPLNVLRARDIMVPPGSIPGSMANAPTCKADTTIREVARLKKDSTEPVVVQRDGAVVGVIGENELLECML